MSIPRNLYWSTTFPRYTVELTKYNTWPVASMFLVLVLNLKWTQKFHNVDVFFLDIPILCLIKFRRTLILRFDQSISICRIRFLIFFHLKFKHFLEQFHFNHGTCENLHSAIFFIAINFVASQGPDHTSNLWIGKFTGVDTNPESAICLNDGHTAWISLVSDQVMSNKYCWEDMRVQCQDGYHWLTAQCK